MFVVLSVTFPDTGPVLAHRSLNALHASRRENVEGGDVVGSQTTNLLATYPREALCHTYDAGFYNEASTMGSIDE